MSISVKNHEDRITVLENKLLKLGKYEMLFNNILGDKNVTEGVTLPLTDKISLYDFLLWEFFGYYHIVTFGKETVQNSAGSNKYMITTSTSHSSGGYFDFIPSVDERSMTIYKTDMNLRVLYGFKIT